MYTVHCTVYIIRCILYNLHYTTSNNNAYTNQALKQILAVMYIFVCVFVYLYVSAYACVFLVRYVYYANTRKLVITLPRWMLFIAIDLICLKIVDSPMMSACGSRVISPYVSSRHQEYMSSSPDNSRDVNSWTELATHALHARKPLNWMSRRNYGRERGGVRGAHMPGNRFINRF